MELIDKNALNFTEFEIVMCEGDFAKAFKLICEKLDNAVIIEAEPIKHAHNLIGDTLFECSKCGYYNDDTTRGTTRTFNYCPNCGARMDEVEEE